jgi:hypothetical protein
LCIQEHLAAPQLTAFNHTSAWHNAGLNHPSANVNVRLLPQPQDKMQSTTHNAMVLLSAQSDVLGSYNSHIAQPSVQQLPALNPASQFATVLSSYQQTKSVDGDATWSPDLCCGQYWKSVEAVQTSDKIQQHTCCTFNR